jgi:hypothetical protein
MTIEPNDPQPRERSSRKGKNPSSAAANVAQAKARAAQGQKVESIIQTRVEQGVEPETKRPTLTAVFPGKGGNEPHNVDLSFLLAFPNLQHMFMEAFLYWGANCTPATRQLMRASLCRYFFAYLETNWPKTLHPTDIDDELLFMFRECLLKAPGARGKTLHPNTVRGALGALRSVLEPLATGPWAGTATRIAERVPSGPTGGGRKSTPTEVLGMEQLLAILEAAEGEVLTIEHRFAKAKALLAEARARLLDPSRLANNNLGDYRDLGACLAALDEAYPGVIPDLQVIQKQNRALARAVTAIHGQGEVSSYFYASGRDLVPFVLLLTVATVFNPDTVLSLDWSNIDFDKDQAGTPAIEIVGAKGRAAEDLVRVLESDVSASSTLSLKQVLSDLEEITSRIRPYLAREHADRVFVFVQQKRLKQPKGFGRDDQKFRFASNDFAWKIPLKNFIRDNNLPPFTLGQLRPSILDLVQFMDGSLEAARKVGNHGSPVTTWTHYTSDGVKKRYRERIGQVIVMRERWLQTGGAIDPRRLTPTQDKGAATPGFSCLDPFDSPRPNQQPGRLCKDYGGCPACPMAAAHPGDPLSVGYYTALEAAIYRSQVAMSARTWIERWTPILSDLAALREWIPPDVLAASREISIRLPNVG